MWPVPKLQRGRARDGWLGMYATFWTDYWTAEMPRSLRTAASPWISHCLSLVSWWFRLLTVQHTHEKLPSLVSSQPSPTISCTRRMQRCKKASLVQLGPMHPENGCPMLELHSLVVDSSHWTSTCMRTCKQGRRGGQIKDPFHEASR